MKQNKYRNTKTVDENGDKFDSAGELCRWRELKLLQKAGIISCLKRQISFELQPGFRHDGKWVAPIRWVPDFLYIEDGKAIVEDFKSPVTAKTPDFRMKVKMFMFIYTLTHNVRLSYKERGRIVVFDI